MDYAGITSNRLPPSENDAIAASSGAENCPGRALSDGLSESPSTMTAHTESTSDGDRPQKGVDHVAGAYDSPQSLPVSRSGGGGSSCGKDLRQQLRALQTRKAEWRRRAEAAEAREKVLKGQLTALKSVVTRHVDQLITTLTALAADADRPRPSGRTVW